MITKEDMDNQARAAENEIRKNIADSLDRCLFPGIDFNTVHAIRSYIIPAIRGDFEDERGSVFPDGYVIEHDWFAGMDLKVTVSKKFEQSEEYPSGLEEGGVEVDHRYQNVLKKIKSKMISNLETELKILKGENNDQ